MFVRALPSISFPLLGGVLLLASPPIPSSELSPVSQEMLCVTEGALSTVAGGELSVSVPKMRAYVNANTTAEAEARFTYQGATDKDVPLGSGEMRRQFGLKLLAQDACNLIYVMWRFEPASKVVVSVKSNPGQSTSAQCGNRGYSNLKPLRGGKVPAMTIGSTHTLQAALKGDELQVLADGRSIWEGNVGREASGLKGPVGIRSDNARLQFTLQTAFARNNTKAGPGCRKDMNDRSCGYYLSTTSTG